MTKRIESRPSQVGAMKGREVSLTDEVIGSRKNIELSALEFEGEEVIYVEYNGMRLYPVYAIGVKFGYSEKNALEAFRNNKKFLEGNYYSLKIRRYERMVSVPCLTGEGVLIYTARLGIGKIPEDRQNKVIRTVQFMAKAAMGVIDGSLISDPKLDWFEERIGTKNNHKLLMRTLKENEVGKYAGVIPEREIYIRESRAINEDVAGVHISGLSDKLNACGLHVKNDAYVSDISLTEAGISFEKRHTIVKKVLNASYPCRSLSNMLLTKQEKARIARKCSNNQRGISEFMAVSA